jgi:hypothetical protein
MQLASEVINAWEDPKSVEDEEEEVSYAGETEREQHRKWREIKAVLMNDGKQCETCICNDDKADPGGHGLENGTIDAEQEHGKAGKEEKKCDVEQRRQYFDRPGNSPPFDTSFIECTNTCSLLRAVRWVGNPFVATCPLQ